jgi:hypothetical protein
MAQLADLQKKIDEAAEEMRHLTQDDHDRRTQHRELRQESSFNKKNGMMTFIIVTPGFEGKPNANHVRARISNSRTQRLHK